MVAIPQYELEPPKNRTPSIAAIEAWAFTTCLKQALINSIMIQKVIQQVKTAKNRETPLTRIAIFAKGKKVNILEIVEYAGKPGGCAIPNVNAVFTNSGESLQ